MLGAFSKFVNPAFYTTAFNGMLTRTAPEVRAGKFMPAIKFMMAVGAIGYVQEYYAIGRFHAAHRKHETEHALAEYKAKHGSAH
ncbi:hypothetical protein TeGR_g4336 [Tetraparma gracilis]|uniref:Uncharacterized protein n=1 Tax=Tetraparma gracilis TaxID=2962635 RepID=A0ABQ6N7T6_9STRA|nr:hypothetical protein TeGR_g4336 [Tetraparma gracilis]